MAVRGIVGYSFFEALARNRDLVKIEIGIIAGYNYFSGFTLAAFLTSVGVGLAALAGKLLIDFVDYVFTDVPTANTTSKKK